MRVPLPTAYDEKRIHVRHSKKLRPAKNSLDKSSPKKSSPKKRSPAKISTSRRSLSKSSPKTSKTPQRATIASSSPLGMMALHLLAQWKESGRSGLVFLAESENRALDFGVVITGPVSDQKLPPVQRQYGRLRRQKCFIFFR